MIIDTHCHLDDERYIDDLDDLIKNLQNNGIKQKKRRKAPYHV